VQVLFLDEPTLGLDPQTRNSLWEYIKKLNTEKGITIILTTHYMEEADRLCDRVAII
jgi:ABC-2 type transport system ATP-binding protein